MVSVALAGPKVHKSRSNYSDPTDGGNVWLYGDCSVAPILQFLVFLMVLPEMEFLFLDVLSLGAQSIRVLFDGFVCPVLPTDIDPRPGNGDVVVFKDILGNLHAERHDFLHRVVVGRGDTAVRSWRSLIKEDSSTRFQVASL